MTGVQTCALPISGKVKSLYTSQGSNGIYYHNSSLANGAGDNSYRYAGANPNNYVCFGSTASTCPSANLYRIIGVFGDQVKLIHAAHATTAEIGTAAHKSDNKFYWSGSESNQSNTWSSSTLNTSSLNGIFLTNLESTWTNKIATTTWNVGGGSNANLRDSNAKTAYNYEVGANKSSTTYNAKIGLPYLNEYYYAATPTYWTYPGYNSDATKDYRASSNSNWMKNGRIYWTISRVSDTSTTAFIVYSVGGVYDRSVYDNYYVRPSFNLASSVKTSGGTGTKSDPYRIEL